VEGEEEECGEKLTHEDFQKKNLNDKSLLSIDCEIIIV
jgi:hypothetical protein